MELGFEFNRLKAQKPLSKDRQKDGCLEGQTCIYIPTIKSLGVVINILDNNVFYGLDLGANKMVSDLRSLKFHT